MNNWYLYQWTTTAMKKVGGPLNFYLLLCGGCASLGYAAHALPPKVKSYIRQKYNKSSKPILKSASHVINEDGLEFKIGDEFRILETIENGALIEKIGDPDNPYVVTDMFLQKITN